MSLPGGYRGILLTSIQRACRIVQRRKLGRTVSYDSAGKMMAMGSFCFAMKI